MSDTPSPESEDAKDEVVAAEKVINAMLFYERYAAIQFKRHLTFLKSMTLDDQRILAPILKPHAKNALECARINQDVLDKLVGAGMHMFSDNTSFQQAYEQVRNSNGASEHYMSKTRSTLKQIVRDWSREGSDERESCYKRVMQAIQSRYPTQRNKINVLVPGCGLGRLNFELLNMGFSVTGNENSFFMILASNYLLNFCRKVEEFTIYPYLLDFSNAWSYEEALKPVKFPDVAPALTFGSATRPNNFSMCAGDFVSAYKSESNMFDCVVTVFFLDTSKNPLEYMRTIFQILKPGGCWINFGPLTYHFEGEDDSSLELPFDTLVSIAEQIGFKMEYTEGKGVNPPSSYTCNPNSMLKYEYNCGFFECSKPCDK